MTECPACGTAAPDGARFCPSCGQALSVRADERRVATVVFADLVGFTSLSEARDPEQVKRLVDRCFERLAADIRAFGGRVDKLLGDAIVALFGAPVAHEDDTERAVRAALQMQRTTQLLADEERVPVRLRVGVNTGEVLVGGFAAGGDWTAMGDTVNVASRLQGLAEPGQVVVGAATRAQTTDVIRYEDLGDVALRGRDGAVGAAVAIEPLAPPGHRPRRNLTPLVGRDRELAVLCNAVDMAVHRRRPHLLVLVGEAGVGKTRLAEELISTARCDHGAKVFEGRCVPYGEANVWWPIAQAARQAAGIGDDDGPEVAEQKGRRAVAAALGRPADSDDVDRVVAGLGWLMGTAAPTEQEPTRARDDAFRALTTLLRAIAEQAPLVFALSELHWADDALLELLDVLSVQLRDLPVVLLATARSELLERWSPRAGRHNSLTLHLDPLDDDAARALVRAILAEAPPDLVADLASRAGGNPFYLEELAGLVRDTGSRTQLPATLRSLVATRLDALPEAERSVLADAAVVGRMGSVEELRALRADGAALPTVLDRLAAADLLSLEGPRWSFRSDLVREVAYETLAKSERARRHAALAEWLGHAPSHGRDRLAGLAHHAASAAELVGELGPLTGVAPAVIEEAPAALARAAADAERREMAKAAVGFWDRYLALTTGGDAAARRHARLRRALGLAVLRRFPEARAEAATVLDEARTGADAHGEASALCHLGRIEQLDGHLLESIDLLRDAVHGFRALGDVAGEADALRHRGMTEMFAGQVDTAERHIERANELFRQLGDARGEAWALQNLAWLAFTRGATAEADERLHRSLDLFHRSGDRSGASWARGLLAWVRMGQGRLAEADALGIEVLAEMETNDDPWARAMMTVLLASTRLWTGRVDEAIELSSEARSLFTTLGDHTGHLRALAPLSRALAAAGRVGEADAVLEEAGAMARREVDPGMRELGGAVVATATAVQRGDARRALASAAPFLEESPAWQGHDGTVAAALALLLGGRTEEAVARLEVAAEHCTEAGPAANVLSALALATVAVGQPAEALAIVRSIDWEAGGTYLDRATALLAEAFAHVRLDAHVEARAVADEAVGVVEATTDRLTAAHVHLGRGRTREALGDPEGTAEAAEALARLHSFGLPGTAWDGVYRRAAGTPGA